MCFIKDGIKDRLRTGSGQFTNSEITLWTDWYRKALLKFVEAKISARTYDRQEACQRLLAPTNSRFTKAVGAIITDNTPLQQLESYLYLEDRSYYDLWEFFDKDLSSCEKFISALQKTFSTKFNGAYCFGKTTTWYGHSIFILADFIRLAWTSDSKETQTSSEDSVTNLEDLISRMQKV
jgi:hypothetical protein